MNALKLSLATIALAALTLYSCSDSPTSTTLFPIRTTSAIVLSTPAQDSIITLDSSQSLQLSWFQADESNIQKYTVVLDRDTSVSNGAAFVKDITALINLTDTSYIAPYSELRSALNLPLPSQDTLYFTVQVLSNGLRLSSTQTNRFILQLR
jgi:hypothetical protein